LEINKIYTALDGKDKDWRWRFVGRVFIYEDGGVVSANRELDGAAG
jgi:hypothetical protein